MFLRNKNRPQLSTDSTETDQEDDDESSSSGDDGSDESSELDYGGLTTQQIVSESVSALQMLSGSGIFSELSMFNHSCDPNASVEFMSWDSRASLVALRDIDPGEEICITYCDETLGRIDRAKELESYMFVCRCVKCTEEPHQQLLSTSKHKNAHTGINESKVKQQKQS